MQISSTSTRIHQGVWEELWSDWGPSGTRSATSAASANAISHLLALKPKVKTTTIRYGHSAGGDSADLTLDSANTVIERTIGLVGGVLITKRTTGDVYSYPNIHGDIVATAVALEVKLSPLVNDDDVRHLLWLRAKLGPELLDAAIITTGMHAYRRPDGVAVIPAALLGP